MPKGAFGQYIIKNQTVGSFTPLYERILFECRFITKERTWDGQIARHKAMFGSKGSSFAVSAFVPFGSLLEEGNRYGAEAEMYQYGPDVILRLLVVPYMTLFDAHDYFLLTQGVFEKILDDERCMKKLGEIVYRIMAYRVQIYTF
ncbi:MAG: hypothetical protein JSW11_14630 [Candidatus Heimdallarchaeota archaeon]|nr:MAG: hypothetical protein JSW11_14630 [Candidatus Heimdallarchaeota archaeon]